MLNKRGQVAIFIIIAIIIVGGIVLFVSFRDVIFGTSIPAELQPVFNAYQACINEETERGLNLLANQGGRINIDESDLGNDYSPFTKNLNFYGVSVPYWYRLDEKGFIEENIPARGDMEEELAQLIEENLNDCDLSSYYEQGFYIDLPDEISSSVSISNNKVEVSVDAGLSVSKKDISAVKGKYDLETQSRLGEFYDAARKLYDYEAETNFAEEYSIDVIRLYAPVDGVEVQCSPKIWKTGEEIDAVKEGLESNIAAIKFQGDDFTLGSKDNKYFVVDANTKVPARLIYSKEWPSVFEISGDKVTNELMIAEAIGNQQGLGVMGFCYVPYHFVYDMRFPVMFQVGDGVDLFQFPVTVIVDNNLAKKAELPQINYQEPKFRMCDFKEAEAEIHTYDEELNPVEADVSFECLEESCDLGRTEIKNGDAVFEGSIPICVNGKIVAKAEGFSDARQTFSSNSESVANVIMEKEYEVGVNVMVAGGGMKEGEQAVIYFENDEGGRSAVIPGNEKVKLKEGQYKIKVYVYGNSGITIPASSKRQCIDAARGGFAGFFGATKEECFNIDIPETKIDYALKGGGQEESYILKDELISEEINLEVQELPSPDSLEQLQYNYELFNSMGVGISFR